MELKLHARINNGDLLVGQVKLDTAQYGRLFDYIQSTQANEINFMSPQVFKEGKLIWESDEPLLLNRQYMVYIGEEKVNAEDYHFRDSGKNFVDMTRKKTPYMFNLKGSMVIGLYSHPQGQMPSYCLKKAVLFNISNVIILESDNILGKYDHLIVNNDYVLYSGRYSEGRLKTTSENISTINDFISGDTSAQAGSPPSG